MTSKADRIKEYRNPESGIEGLLYAGYRDYEQLRI